MSRVRTLFASLALASSLATGCTTHVHAARPVPVAPAVQIDRAAVRAKLAARRAETFGRFLAYREARVYPVNHLGGMRHLWFDDAGNLCAAATIIRGDWGHDATVRVGIGNRELRMADVNSGPLLDWILMSGLTQHELVAIQAPGFTRRWMERNNIRPADPETTRLYQLYTDVQRQMESLWGKNLDEAVDALMKHPDLARKLLRDQLAGPGDYAKPVEGERIARPGQPVEPPPAEPAEPTIAEPAIAEPAVEPAA